MIEYSLREFKCQNSGTNGTKRAKVVQNGTKISQCYLQRSKVSYYVSTMKIQPTDYAVYLYHVGDGNHQLFIKNVSADADFIRVIVGYTEMTRNKRTGKILNQWIITPLQPQNEHVHIGDVRRNSYRAKRLWVAFEAVRRGKRSETVGVFVALSPRPSVWRTRTGALTHFELKAENAASNAKWMAHWQNAIQ